MKKILAAAALCVMFLARPASAATRESTLTVSATVIGICTIDPAALAFGSYDSDRRDATATVTVHCTQGSTFWIGLGAGNNATTSRRMRNGTTADYLAYELYRDEARTQLWDNAAPGTTTAAGLAGTAAYTATVYGRIPADQVVPMGTYGDTVTMTVNF